MNRYVSNKRLTAWICTIMTVTLLTACSMNGNEEAPPAANKPIATKSPVLTPEQIAQDILNQLKNKDMEKLAAFVHPEKGVRLSPYAYVDVKKDRILKPHQLKTIQNDNTIHEWGTYDGSGEPIQLKFSEYYAKFVFDVDFTTYNQTATNKRIGEGTTKSNIEEVYPQPNHVFVEYYISGIDPKYEGMDWKSLRLVFERVNEKLLLVGIIHDQWTI